MHCSVHQRLFSARSIVLTVASQCFYETDSMITNSGLWLPFLLRGEGKKPESLDNQARGQRVPILINFLRTKHFSLDVSNLKEIRNRNLLSV